MLKIRTPWILWFVFLAVPGSGFLRFDGLPFSSKLEFTAIAISTVALISTDFRYRFRKIFARNDGQRQRWLTTLLVSAIILKFFTYALLPLGDGFEACYRSIYEPPKAEVACEKSYEAPFLNTDAVNGLNQITRMEPVIDFGPSGEWILGGASQTTWRLPFVNDYPRLGALWLDRLPFTAKFGSLIYSSEESEIPIQFVGEIKVSINGQEYAASSYEHPTLLRIPVPKGRHELRIEYKFADLDSPIIPDQPPTVRGPWAQLFVGSQISTKSELASAKLIVSGWALNQDSKVTPEIVELRNNSDEVVASTKTSTRQDVADHFKDNRYVKSGFTIEVTNLGEGNGLEELKVFAKYKGDKQGFLGKINLFSKEGREFLTPVISLDGQNGSTALFDSWYSIDKKELDTLSPLMPEGNRGDGPVGLLGFFLLFSSDLVALAIVLLIAGLALVSVRRKAFGIARISVWFLLCNWAVSNFKFSWWGYQSSVIPLLIAISLGVALSRNKNLSLFWALTGALVAVTSPILYLVRRFNGLGDAPWWGFQLFRGRESDWFVSQGYARQIFVDASLRGGEGVFYFQPATRYFVFLQHLLFGENDILLTILMSAGVLVAAVFAAREALKHFSSWSGNIVVFVFVAACFTIFTQQISLAFASAPSSEFTTWIFILLTFGLILRGNISQQHAIVLTVLAGLTAQFRPNQVFGAIFLFLLIQLEIPMQREFKQLHNRIRLVIVFGSILSLSLIHNLYYGSTFAIFSNTGGINSDLSFSSLLKIFSDGNVREIVFYKLRLLGNWGWPANPLALSFWALDILWLLAIVKTILLKNFRLKIWVVLMLPLAYLLPHLPYDFASYYPRHVVAMQLAFGLSALYVHRLTGPNRWSTKTHKTLDAVSEFENA